MRLQLVEHWQRFYKAWTVQVAALGVLLPEILGLIADNSHALPWVDEEVKSVIRLCCLISIPVLRVLKQRSLS